jgi:3-dehydroquinate dehydratase-2
MTRILVLNGPNLNLLGSREPELYGTTTLAEIEARLSSVARELDVELEFAQSNHEGALLDALHAARGRFQGVLINPGALAHTSLALGDGLVAAGLPAVEVHLTNPAARERIRHQALTARGATGYLAGFGARSYEWGLRALVAHLRGATG